MFANGFSLLADEPVALGGGNERPSPYEYLLAALGACTTMTLQMYARRKGWRLEQALVRLSDHKNHVVDCENCDTEGRRMDRFEWELELTGELDENRRHRLLEIAEKCPVHRTLTGEVRMATSLRPA